jgi:hypothetical protein
MAMAMKKLTENIPSILPNIYSGEKFLSVISSIIFDRNLDRIEKIINNKNFI